VLLKALRSAAPWGWPLWLAACLHSAFSTAASPMAAPSAAAFTVTLAVAFALVAAVALAGRTRLDAAFARDPGPGRAAVRARVERTAFLPQRDPDASGRPRPRAPGH
jgi:Family of unknown function (DUF6412)